MTPHQGMANNKTRNETNPAPFLSAKEPVRGVEIRVGATAAMIVRLLYMHRGCKLRRGAERERFLGHCTLKLDAAISPAQFLVRIRTTVVLISRREKCGRRGSPYLRPISDPLLQLKGIFQPTVK